MWFIYSLAVKSYSDLKIVNFSVLKIGFHGETFVAREHNTNDMFHFTLKFKTQLMWVSKQT